MYTEKFETCWDDDQVEIFDWISEQLKKNPDAFYEVEIKIKEVEYEE